MAEKFIIIQHSYFDMEVNCDEEYAEFCHNEHYKLVGIVETEEQAKKLCDEWNHSAESDLLKAGLRFDEKELDEDDFDEEEFYEPQCVELMYRKVPMLGAEFVFEPEIL